ncbi:MAG: YfhO family protein [Chitinispirillales bacterium]|nr:YfhO family protein [Chitinispirillales bacterium]
MEIAKNNRNMIHIAIIAFMALIVLCLFHELINSNKMLLASDQINTMGIKSSMQRALLEDGQIAMWNKGVLCGMPTGDALAGDYLYPLVFPFNYLAPIYAAFSWKMILHVFLAGLFFYLMLFKGFGLSPTIAGIGAIFYMLNPEFFSHVYPGHDGKMYVIALLPYMIWRLKEGLCNPNFANTALFALGIGLGLLTSHIQMMFFTFIGLGAIWLFFTIFEVFGKKNVKITIKPALFFWGSVVLGLSLGAAQLYPAFRYVQDAHSIRGVDRGFEFATSWSMHWAEIFSLWVPEFGNWFGYYWSGNAFKLNTEYVGAVAMITAFSAFVFKPSKWRFFCLSLGIFFLLLSMGADSPGIRFSGNPEDKISIYTIAYHFIPGVKKFRAMAMVMYWFSFVIVFLSALSLKDILDEEWKNWSEIRLKNTKFGLLISIPVIIAVSFVFANQNFVFGLMQPLCNSLAEKKNIFEANFQKNYIPALIGWTFIAIIIIGGIWAVICGRLKKGLLFALILVLGMIDTIRVNKSFIQYQSNAQYKKTPNAIADVLRKTKNEPARSMYWPGIDPNVNIESFYGLEGVNGFHDNELVRYREFRGQGGMNYLSPIFERANMGYSDPISDGGNALNLANCKYVFYPNRTGQLQVIENKNAMPRLAFTNSYIVESDRSIISETINNADFAVHETAILEQKPSFESVGENVNTQISTKWLKYTANDRIADVEVSVNGLLRISEVYYPAWKVFIDGKKAEIINCDLAFMAVEVPAGKHKVQIKIDSLYMNTALLLSIPGCIFLLLALSLNFTKKKVMK